MHDRERLHVAEHVPLAPLTTLRLGGTARRLVTAEHDDDVVATIADVDRRGEPLLVLGGGSNVVLADEEFDGTVLRVGTRGRVRIAAPSGGALVTAKAGESWDEFVAWTVDGRLSGLECLAGIPGLVGAVPMQNVGAYGEDVGGAIVRLRAYDRQQKQIVEIDHAACAFAYRSSVFRGSDRHVILDVTFALDARDVSRPIRYAELAKGLAVAEGSSAPLKVVRDTVVALRRRKGMVLDPADPDTTSAGSFFTNPILTRAALAALRARPGAAEVPVFPEPDGRFKVSAAWLIEHAGFVKGYASSSGRVAISSKHALALTNRGGATTRELVELARLVRDGVRDQFGVTLEPEPIFVGIRLPK